MTPQFDYPRVTDELLNQIIQKIISVGTPLQIILFGSYAQGNARPDSDLDILIVEESELPRHQRASRYYQATTGLFPKKDITVWTMAEIEAWSAVPNAFITTVLEQGKVLYERPK
ncbi:nucleotidyltransferase domain-containing protein [Thermosynechococcaceae cyanobacterium BACA0444]|uniref:Nucleotidyltransferase domain-containing protein n=1 Tax=Pseudocalidococcus azoricus BACA0444 TaxID=2918990 RepID=A0AAE4FTG6_9CYAN|nr:nucleotidyltransferase domain-containing protein [Pseudocalidococcus azoricus]MDS3861002.1 nucleotidyltransferase domain-containing protein [Pseudocalidococcus azoricus BACA0444]